MLGQIKLEEGGWGTARRADLYGMTVLRTRIDLDGWMRNTRLRRGGRGLYTAGVRRVLLPASLEDSDVLKQYGLAPVDPGPLVRACAPDLALTALRAMGQEEKRAAVALRASRVDRDMARSAALLCGQVRHIIIDAPQGGEELAVRLHREFGLPVLPPEEEGVLALRFDHGAASRENALELYGLHPDLAGLLIRAPGLAEEDQEDIQVLTALWQGGKLPRESLNITYDT